MNDHPQVPTDPGEVLEHFERFSQRDDIFCRSFWDPTIRSRDSDRFYATYREPLANWRKADGFTQRDYALRNASWHVTDVFAELKEDEDRREGYLDPFTVLREPPAEHVSFESAEAASAEIKRVGKLFGADLVGVAPYDERWVYTHVYSREREHEKPNELPEGLLHAVVIGREMDHALIDTVPSALSGAATGWGYSEDTLSVLALAQYIRNLGYQAVATLNDTALAVPLAIQAGLGEYGRLGLVITKEYGPRVRFAKIFTDMPLANDRPVSFGVKQFCDVCTRCVDACPVRAIPEGPPTDDARTRSSLVGVRKWTIDPEKCFDFWAKQNSDCSICIRVCPYNRSWPRPVFALWRRLAATPLRRLLAWLDEALGFGARRPARAWWGQGESRSPRS